MACRRNRQQATGVGALQDDAGISMTIHDLNWDPVHTSGYVHARGLPRPAEAKALSTGAFRYRCPITGSFVLVTDDATLQKLSRPNARLRCADCGDLHLLECVAEELAPVGAATAVTGPALRPAGIR